MFSRIKQLFAKPPAREFNDPELGVLVLADDIWGGKVVRDGRDLRFYVAGTQIAPDAGLLDRIRRLLKHFPETEKAASDFLRSSESQSFFKQLDFYAFDFLWPDKPDNFTFEFLANGNDSQVWRVEFVDGNPRHTGFDD